MDVRQVHGIEHIFLLGDLHLGVRNNSQQWMKIQEDFLLTEFPRQIKESGCDPSKSILILEGDIFHDRQKIDITVLYAATRIFNGLCKIFPNGVFVIAGNHDVYFKETNDVTSLDTLKYLIKKTLRGVFNVYTKPVRLEVNSKHKYLLLPWEHDNEKLTQVIKENEGTADYIICHADIKSAQFNRFVRVETGLEPKALSKYKKVYAGHIHIRQEFNRAGSVVSYTGTPYQMDRGDVKNQKGFDILTLSNDGVVETFVPNKFSPEFVKWNVYKLLNMSTDDIRAAFANNFVDISVDTRIADRFTPTTFLELIGESGARSIEFTNYSSETDVKVKDLAQSITNDEFSLDGIFELYCDQKTYDNLLRKKITDKFRGYLKSVRDTQKTVL